MNSLNIIGNLGGDCEVRYTQAGKPVGTFSVAITSGWGERKTTTWVRCTLFGDRAEKLSPYIKKGDRIGVCGELELQEWDSEQGKKQTLCCIVRDVTLLGDKKSRTESASGAARSSANPEAGQGAGDPATNAGGEFDDETIPF